MPGRMAINSSGLGQASSACLSVFGGDIAASDVASCASAAYYILPPCWCMGQAAWQTLAAEPVLATPTAGPGVPPGALNDPNAVLEDTTGSASQTASDQQIAQNQQIALSGAQSNPIYPDTNTDPDATTSDGCQNAIGINCPTLMIVGLVIAVGFFVFGGKR